MTTSSVDGIGRPSTARIGLHLDGVAVLAAAVAGYVLTDGRWWLFAVLILAPDLFMLGYLRSTRVGAVVYNLGHTYFTPGLVVVLGFLIDVPTVTHIAIIWIAHIAFDRVAGYGFKLPDAFGSTHYQRT